MHSTSSHDMYLLSSCPFSCAAIWPSFSVWWGDGVRVKELHLPAQRVKENLGFKIWQNRLIHTNILILGFRVTLMRPLGLTQPIGQSQTFSFLCSIATLTTKSGTWLSTLFSVVGNRPYSNVDVHFSDAHSVPWVCSGLFSIFTASKAFIYAKAFHCVNHNKL